MIFCKIDVDEAKEVASSFKVTGMPTFVFLHKNVEKFRMTGADMKGFVTALDKYENQFNVFSSGAGNRLNAPSETTQAPVSNTVVAAAKAPVSAPAPRRNNPWADPNWKPPSVVAPPVVEKVATAQHVPMDISAPTASSSGVDDSIVAQLVDMGFDKERSKVACSKTKNNLEHAMEWLLNPDNENATLDSTAPIVPTSSSKPVAVVAPVPEPNKPKWVPGQKGAPLG